MKEPQIKRNIQEIQLNIQWISIPKQNARGLLAESGLPRGVSAFLRIPGLVISQWFCLFFFSGNFFSVFTFLLLGEKKEMEKNKENIREKGKEKEDFTL